MQGCTSSTSSCSVPWRAWLVRRGTELQGTRGCKTKGKKVRIGRGPHRENVRVVGEDEEGPKLPDFAGDRRGRRGPCRRFVAVHIDSSCRNHPGHKAKANARLSCRGRAPGYNAMVRRAWWRSGAYREEEKRVMVAALGG
jgi:hypothetical protein